jgi:hypothetical protein
MHIAVRIMAINSLVLLQIKIHDSTTLVFKGLLKNEKKIIAKPEIKAPHIPYQNTAFSTFT